MAKSKKTQETPLALGLDQEDKRVLWRTIAIASVLLGIFLAVTFVVLGKVFPEKPGFLNAARTGISLLAFWIFTTSAVRTFDRFRPNVAFYWLVLVGVATAAIGIVLFLTGLRLWNELGSVGAELPSYSIIGFYTAAALVASLISLIHIRVENEMTGNLLELLVIVIAAAFFFWVTQG